jgi:rubrerythrin
MPQAIVQGRPGTGHGSTAGRRPVVFPRRYGSASLLDVARGAANIAGAGRAECEFREAIPMELHSHSILTAVRTKPLITCAQCGKMIYVAEWSEAVDERRVRHLWECSACGYTFETMARFPAAA